MGSKQGPRQAFPGTYEAYEGLTKRELFAAMAMQGHASNPAVKEGVSYEDIAVASVRQADALLSALEEKPDA